MRKLTILSVYVLGIGFALQVPSAFAQTSGTTAKPPATQSTTSGTTTKPAAAKPPASAAAKPAALTLKDEKEKTSYALGMNIAHTVKTQPLDLDAAFIQGVKDVLSGGKTLLTEEEMAAALAVLQTEMNARAAEQAKQVGEMNKTEGAAFLVAKRHERRGGHAAERIAIQNHHSGNGRQAHRGRYGNLQLSRHAHRWQGI